MSHLHIPDGVLPPALWAAGLAAAAALAALCAWVLRDAPAQRLGYRAALGALMLVAMSVPLGPLGYHLSLLGVVGVLLGPAAAYLTAFVVSGTLALFGHGGVTVAGLNALVLGAGAAVARPCFTLLPRSWGAGRRAAVAAVAAQAASGVALLALVAAAARLGETGRAGHPELLFGGLALPIWIVGSLAEAGAALGIVGFLDRTQPALLPAGRTEGR